MDKYILVFFTSAILSLIFTPLVRYFAIRYKVVANPREDRWHKNPTALLGGLGIYLSFFATYLIFRPLFNQQVIGLLLAGTVIFFFGLSDDILRLKPQVKLIAQIIAGCVAAYFNIIPQFIANPIFSVILAIIWIVGITNSINLLDNMDGLASGVAGIAFIFVAFSSFILKNNPLGALALIFAGAIVGFLPYNFNPAKIFMGDSGSMFLGFGLAALTLMGGSIQWHHLLATLAIPVLILAVPIFDTSLVTLVRILKGASILKGGKDHVSHRLVSLGLSERKSVLLLYILSIIFGLVALLYSRVDVIIITLLSTLAIIVLLFFGIFLAEVRTFQGNQLEKERFKQLREGRVILNTLIFNKRRIAEVMVDLALICVSYYTAYLLRFEGTINNANYILIKNSLPWVILIRMLCLWQFGLYRGIWRYIGINDLISLFKAVSFSSAFIILAITLRFRFGEYSRVVFVIDWLLTLFFLSGIRVFIRAMDEYFSRQRLSGKKRLLIIGAGDSGELLLRELKRNPNLDYNPIGFIDDDFSKVGRSIHGIPVLGTRQQMLDIVKEKEIDEIIVAIPSASREDLKEIFDICSACEIPYRQIYGMFTDEQGKNN
jgi:UDP-GlcNAc:undecaprenyl-phosphate GlcNAc-1-phosphate transferase